MKARFSGCAIFFFSPFFFLQACSNENVRGKKSSTLSPLLLLFFPPKLFWFFFLFSFFKVPAAVPSISSMQRVCFRRRSGCATTLCFSRQRYTTHAVSLCSVQGGCRVRRTSHLTNADLAASRRRWCGTVAPPADRKPTSPGDNARVSVAPAAVTTPLTSSPPSASADAALFSVNDHLHARDVPLRTPTEVENAFACSVAARTISNAQLRRYLEHLEPRDYALGVAAVKGAKSAGLRVNASSYEALMTCLMGGGQLRASMELYQQMIQQHMTPTPNMYAELMELCLQREMPKQCQTLFNDLQKRGVRPSARNYELMITSLAAEVPPQWERAIAVFDKVAGERNSRVTAQTYNALMRVYLNMEPFDWRVVYNCYTEMRTRRPRIRLEWESYLILREALRKGQAGHVRRAIAYCDAWIAVTPLRSWNFLMGAAVYFAIMMVIKMFMSYAVLSYYEATAASTADTVLPV